MSHNIRKIPEYEAQFISLNFKKDHFETMKTPLLRKFHLPESGSIRSVESDGTILPKSVRDIHIAVNNLCELYDNGLEDNSDVHVLAYILSADMLRYIPVSLRILCFWDSEIETVGKVVGVLRLVKTIPASVCPNRKIA